MIGTTIGHYRITGKIGAGGMGEVFLAEDMRLERKAAIKFLPLDVAAAPDRRERFFTEAKAASALNHPHVCTVYEVGETADGRPFIAMEFIEGESLDALVVEGPLPISRVVEIAVQVADALEAAHGSRIIHRDIKPANISINERGTVKVLDFGLAKRLPQMAAGLDDVTRDLRHTQVGQVLGTPRYMSPEQALGKELDYRTDLFSFGVVLFEMITGRSPFGGESLGELVNNIVNSQPQAISRFNYDAPPELERITLKCLQKSPDRRYQSARELLVDLKNLARELEHGGTAVTGSFSSSTDNRERLEDALDAAPLSRESLKASDVLLAYAAIDDRPLVEGRPGWVSQLHHNLEVRVEQLSGEKVRIARLANSSSSHILEPEILEHLPHTKAMISVVSPPFIKSEICRREVEQFRRAAEQTGGLWVEQKPRLLKVLKTAISNQEMPPAMSDIFSPLLGFEFFELDPKSGRVREFDETFGPALKQRFFERVYDLAYDVCHILRAVKQLRGGKSRTSDASGAQQWIYLATTTSDVQDERDRIKRELLERGHVVLPEAPLPMISRDVETVVQDCLAKCSIAIHLLGRHYGVTPEDSSESLPALQVRLTADQAQRRNLQRLVWMPGNGDSADQRQREFLVRVQEDPKLHHRAEIIEGNLNLLKKDLIRRLNPPEEKPAAPQRGGGVKSTPKLYLICDAKDEPAVEALEDFLFEQGLEVCLPAFDGSDTDAEALHRDNLLTCDAALVYYGAAPKAWVDIKLRELLKAAGFGRETPIELQGVYVAPPDDHRKERYRSHEATVIRQPLEFAPTPELFAFVGAVKEACQ